MCCPLKLRMYCSASYVIRTAESWTSTTHFSKCSLPFFLPFFLSSFLSFTLLFFLAFFLTFFLPIFLPFFLFYITMSFLSLFFASTSHALLVTSYTLFVTSILHLQDYARCECAHKLTDEASSAGNPVPTRGKCTHTPSHILANT